MQPSSPLLFNHPASFPSCLHSYLPTTPTALYARSTARSEESAVQRQSLLLLQERGSFAFAPAPFEAVPAIVTHRCRCSSPPSSVTPPPPYRNAHSRITAGGDNDKGSLAEPCFPIPHSALSGRGRPVDKASPIHCVSCLDRRQAAQPKGIQANWGGGNV